MRTRMRTARRMNNGILAIEIDSRMVFTELYGGLQDTKPVEKWPWTRVRRVTGGNVPLCEELLLPIICIPATSDCGGGSERGTAAFRRLLVL